MLILLPLKEGAWTFILKFIPFVVFFEMPIYLGIMLGVMKYGWKGATRNAKEWPYYPSVTCIIICSNEGDAIKKPILSLAEQIYLGNIEIIVAVDGAYKNMHTYEVAKSLQSYVNSLKSRRVTVFPKWKRGGRVSSMNLGLSNAKGEVIIAADGDTSFDNTMIREASRHFIDPNVVGVSGNIRVRNRNVSLITRFQALEYMLSISLARTGMSAYNAVNNISGAFGIFKKSFLEHIGGWDTGTAEDLDLTLRIKGYFARHTKMRIVFEPKAIGHTDVPETVGDFLKQRLRWEGDLYYLYVRKHWMSFTSRLIGLTNFIFQIWTGLFFQIVMPFIIVIYVISSIIILPTGYIFAVWAVIYLFYLATTFIFYIAYIILLSERPKEDIALAPMTILFPLINMGVRFWSALATLREAFVWQHLDTTMAPWWVVRKSKF